ncbi:immunoglobulin-like domain-containing receptor 2 isoform X2 [Lates japonicus]|nr:immunoglobulin-like domain-containing receptor 2 isoform X2 [Lates japonicus]
MFLTPKCWIFIVCVTGILPPCCLGVHVYVRDEKRYAVLFQSVVLPCQYTSVSTQTPVVQWVYKSYCRDRTRDSFSFPDNLGGGLGGGGLSSGTGGAGGGYETGMTASYLDCSDNSRTVRTVASISGSSITLSEYYKNRDISIINKADLRIGEVQWGDSGVYICKVVISDDLEGQNEASVELLVLGFSGVPEDLLPDFDLKIMPVDKMSSIPASDDSLLTAARTQRYSDNFTQHYKRDPQLRGPSGALRASSLLDGA